MAKSRFVERLKLARRYLYDCAHISIDAEREFALGLEYGAREIGRVLEEIERDEDRSDRERDRRRNALLRILTQTTEGSIARRMVQDELNRTAGL